MQSCHVFLYYFARYRYRRRKMAGISSEEIDFFVARHPAMEINFCGTYAIDQLVTDFVPCATRIEEGKKAKLPFAVANTDPIAECGTHWISFVRLQDRRSFFLFDSFGLFGFQQFVRTDDGDQLAEFLSGFDTEKQNGVSFYSFTFDADAFLNLNTAQRARLLQTCLGMMIFFTAFAAVNDMARILVYGIVDQLQSATTSTCGGFVLKFLEQVYDSRSATVCKHAKCTVHTMRDIISATFRTGSKTVRISNEQLVDRFMTDNDIRGEW